MKNLAFTSIVTWFINRISLVLLCNLLASNSLYADNFISTWSRNAESGQESTVQTISDSSVLKTSAFWIQTGLGKTTLSIGGRSFSQSFAAEASMHLRKAIKVFAAGVNFAGTETKSVVSFWGAYGYSSNTKWADFSFMAGLGFSKRSYNTESELGTIRSNLEPAIILKAQHVVHFPHGLGLGLGCTFHQSQNIRYLSLTLYAAIGSWSW
ncbi:hypothetical protein GF406_19480 [candidate division KSB1 bacterium]|nr:hypothetical protein [candidate division KSB1 bacterium]